MSEIEISTTLQSDVLETNAAGLAADEAQPLQKFRQDAFFIVNGNRYGEAKSSGRSDSSSL